MLIFGIAVFGIAAFGIAVFGIAAFGIAVCHLRNESDWLNLALKYPVPTCRTTLYIPNC
jgi:hypothetical protein